MEYGVGQDAPEESEIGVQIISALSDEKVEPEIKKF